MKTGIRYMAFAPICLSLVLSLTSAFVSQSVTAEAETKKSFDIVKKTKEYQFENSYLSLEINPEDASVTVTDKNTNLSWRTNPSVSGKEISDAQKQGLLSQISLSYTDDKNNSFAMNSYRDSIQKGQFTITSVDSGVRVDYVLGDAEGALVYPMVMDKKVFDKYTEKMSQTDKAYVLSYYNYFDYDKITNERERKDLLKKYPSFRNRPIYVCRSIAARIQKKLSDIFKSVGMTAESLNKAYKEIGLDLEVKQLPRFKLSLLYILENDQLVVSCPASMLEYDASAYRLIDVTLLKQFGAQEVGTAGYILVPDGSGALLDTSTDNANTYNQPVYGRDYAKAEETFEGYTQTVSLPVYGIQRNGQAFLAAIESGAACANLSAGCNSNNGYYYATCSFSLTPYEYYRMEDRTREGLTSYLIPDESDIPDMTLRYFLLSGEKANYSGMAAAYRRYLFGDTKRTLEEQPLYIRSIGAVSASLSDYGLPFTVTRALTKYDDVVNIAKDLQESGISNIQYIFDGWANGGMLSTVSNRINAVGVLGGKKGLSNMLSWFAEEAASVYPVMDVASVGKNRLFDGFSPGKDAARALNNTFAKKYRYNVATLTPDEKTYEYAISPHKYLSYANGFLKDYSSYSGKGIYIADLAEQLNSNLYKKKNQIVRHETEEYVVKLLSELKSQGYTLTASGGNAYVLPYVSRLVDVALTDSNFNSTLDYVPFVAMVLHGKVSFSGVAMNLAENVQLHFLRSMESGAALQYFVNAASVDRLRNTGYESLFSSDYSMTKEEILESYKRSGEYLNNVSNLSISYHTICDNGLRVTVYENGVVCVINPTETQQTYEHKTVEAGNFIWFTDEGRKAG